MKISKRLVVSASHRIAGHKKCGNTHGHNFLVKVEIIVNDSHLSGEGYLLDFGRVEELIVSKLDHKDLNQVLGLDSVTCEILALEIVKMLNQEFTRVWQNRPRSIKVTVWETPNSSAQVAVGEAIYEQD
ncbi:MAG: 6-carboxytetrahydropterin synthase [Thermofilum sp.]